MSTIAVKEILRTIEQLKAMLTILAGQLERLAGDETPPNKRGPWDAH